MILQGDALDQLQGIEEGSVDLIVTDPPYGYSFMGKDWDKAVPSVEIWQQALRVLKPGAFMFVMSAPRSDVQNAMISRIMDAGFRMDFSPIYWTYASGFPKAGNIGKLVDKRLGVEREVVGKQVRAYSDNPESGGQSDRHSRSGHFGNTTQGSSSDLTAPASDEAKALDGSYAGFQPKPAVEVILVAMKPLSQKTFVDQALDNGKGITWLDDVRIPTSDKKKFPTGVISETETVFGRGKGRYENKPRPDDSHASGRFPANLLVSDDVLNDGKVTTTNSRGGVRKAGTELGQSSGYNAHENRDTIRQPLFDSGSYSRYFDIDRWWAERLKELPESVRKTFPYLIVPKASKAEKNEGLQNTNLPEKIVSGESNESGVMGINTPENRERRGVTPDLPAYKNHHPTVKPIKLMSYLITLGSRKGDVVLDPFVGSGTTCIAAKILGRDYIGIEREPEYAEIAEARIKAAKEPEPTLFGASL